MSITRLITNLFSLLLLKAWHLAGYVSASLAGVHIKDGARLSPRARFGRGVWIGRVEVGSDVVVGIGSYINGGHLVSVRMGRYCSVATGVLIGPTDHDLNLLSTSPVLLDQGPSKPPTVIGDDVWIGAHAIILRGVTIGDGAVIGAGALVVKDVAPYTVVGGVPARPIRERFTDQARRAEAIAFLANRCETDPK